jgi:predicted dehydrogenase
MKITRRDFVKSSVAGLAYSNIPIIGAQNKTYSTALIGSGWWGMNILRSAIESRECKAVALCDVDERQLDKAYAEVEKLSGDKPKRYKDYRELLQKEKPDIAIVATPDHWHALPTIAALKAGAHVYVEKPIGHTINEGRAMVKAAREADRIVQVGTHRRASPHNISGIEFLRSGKAGKIGMVRAFAHSPGGAGELVPDAEPPAGLDWNMWCGPAPLRPFNPKIHPKGFRNFLDYANGTVADWGIHWFDQILWWTEEKYPKKIFSIGDRHIKQDNTDAPDTQVVSYEFESFTAVWEHRQYAGNENEKSSIGVYFYGTEGVFHMGWRDGWTFYPSNKSKSPIHEDAKLNQPDNQNIKELWSDFLQSIKNHKRPVSDIEIGHRSTNMSLLGMLSYKLGRSIEWNGEKELVINDSDANKLLSRPYRSPWEYPKL